MGGFLQFSFKFSCSNYVFLYDIIYGEMQRVCFNSTENFSGLFS